MKVTILAALCGVLAVPMLVAQRLPPRVQGTLSISYPEFFSNGKIANWKRNYADYEAVVGSRWRVQTSGPEPNSPFTFCWSHDDSPGECIANFGRTDQYGNWMLEGTFVPENVGEWTEWIQYPSGAVSNRITFSVRPAQTARKTVGAVTFNGTASGVFHVGEFWEMKVSGPSSYPYTSQPFELCTETDGMSVTCKPNVGTLAAGYGLFFTNGVFSTNELGGKSVWAKFPTGEVTKRAVLVVDEGQVNIPTCQEGTLYPNGPMASFANFLRYAKDWYPEDSGAYKLLGSHSGGLGKTLEYTGCNGSNSVWLQWTFGGLGTAAVRAPWNGSTDRGLRIGDTLNRFRELYPTAHHPLPLSYGFQTLWPTDLDVWEVGPLRVAFRGSLVTMMQVDWHTNTDYGDSDLDYSRSTTIGPTDSGSQWK